MIQAIIACLVSAALLAGAAQPVSAQYPNVARTTAADTERYFDYFISRQLPANGADRPDAGFGGRIMWALPGLIEVGQPLLQRSAIGGYLVQIPEDRQRREVWHYGLQADVSLMRAPLLGRIHPLVSMAVGGIRAHEDFAIKEPAGELRPLVFVERPAPLESRVTHHLTITPGVGARVRLVPGLDLRGDLRRLLTLPGGMEPKLEFAGGLSIRV